MAIIADERDERGYVFDQQYIRVDKIHAEKTTMQVEIGVYKNQQAAQNGESAHRNHFLHADFDMNSPQNAWQQAYVAVKQRYPDGVDA